jgi:Tol biopolymer transport system component/streptogramin lyase
MPDLKTRFRGAERITTPDLWPDITSREPRRPAQEPSLARRVLVSSLAFALAVGAIALVVRAFEGPPDRRQPITPAPGSINGVIAYASIGEQQVFWTIRSDGSDRTRVHVDVPGFVRVPSWSPDGTRIVFDVNSFDDPHPEGGNFDIYVSNAAGTDPIRLTAEKVDHNPVWSPDGTEIAYVHGWDAQAQIWVMKADGSGPHQVTDRRGPNLFPSWSPDGTKIAFVSFDGSNANIYVMNADGSNVERLTDDAAHEDQPAWSPDGRQLAFTSEGGGNPGIYVVSPDGTGVTQVLDDQDPANLGFAWSPDGTKMAVVSIRGPGSERTLYVLDIATGESTAIGEPGAFYGPSWQPVVASESAPTPSPSPQVDVSTVEIRHGGGIDVAVGEGSVWVSTVDGIVRIDPATGETLAEIAVGEPPFECAFDLAVGFGSVWATRGCEGGTEVVRIDPGTNRVVARVPLEEAYCVEVGEGAVWATASGAGLVARIDPASNEVVETIPVGAGSGPGGIGCLAVGEGGVWVTRGGDRDSLVRIDPTSDRIVSTIDLPNPDYWNQVVVEGGMVLVAIGGPDVPLEDGSKTNAVRVVRIDPMTNEVVGEPVEVGYGMFGIGSGDGSVWVYEGFSDAITQIDAASGDVVRVIPVPDGGSSWGGDPGIDARDGLVWMAGGKLLNRIDVSGS